MRRKALLTLALFGLVALAGCTSTIEFWRDNTNDKLKVWRRDLHQIHKSLDYHFLNHDWDDPYI
ncbi:MAG: hypothetical protein RL885_10895 [Planctomycetota bacterium]